MNLAAWVTMMFAWGSIQRFLSCCLGCGSLCPDAGLLCRPCQSILSRYHSESKHQIRNMEVHTVYDWFPQKSDALSRMILHSKGGKLKPSWDYYANALVKKPSFQEALGLQQKSIVVVPAPAKKVGVKDHAYQWGLSLAQALGAEFVPCLKRTSFTRQEQKRLDIYERSLLQTTIDENYTAWPKNLQNCLWIFADDIVTTGSTAHSASLALGSPAHFQVAALAYRRLSCGGSKNLL